MREWFKKTTMDECTSLFNDEVTDKQFKQWAKKSGASYVEKDEYGQLVAVFMSDTIFDDTRPAVLVTSDGWIRLGIINMDCKNFESYSNNLSVEDVDFYCTTYKHLVKSVS